METLMLASTAIDLVAIAVLAWLVWRSGRERDAALGMQRAALEALRTDLAELVQDAERRTQALGETLDDREVRLRALLADLERAERARARTPAAAPPESAERVPLDPAEARLVRDLQLRLGGGPA
jgi:hypothetical protein